MALLPQSQQDQVKFIVGVLAIGLSVAYYMYPYRQKAEQLAADAARVEQLEDANRKAAREFASGSIETLRAEAAENRSALVVMRRLVPTGNEVPALLEEVSTAARRAGLDVGGVTPEPVITGDQFDTYRYTVTIIGGYHEFGQFLANVGSLPRIVAPVHFSLATGSANFRAAGSRAGSRPATTRGPKRTELASTITLQTYVERTAPAPVTRKQVAVAATKEQSS